MQVCILTCQMPTEVIHPPKPGENIHFPTKITLAPDEFQMLPVRETPAPLGELPWVRKHRDKWMLEEPNGNISFLVGALNTGLNPQTGMMRPEDIAPIRTIRRTYRELGVLCPNSHTRQLYGLYSVSPEYATENDKARIFRSRKVTVLPKFRKRSQNASNEVRLSLTLGIGLIFTFRAEDPEEDVQEEMRDWVAHSPALKDPVYFVTFDNQEDLSGQLTDIWYPLLGRRDHRLVHLKI